MRYVYSNYEYYKAYGLKNGVRVEACLDACDVFETNGILCNEDGKCHYKWHELKSLLDSGHYRPTEDERIDDVDDEAVIQSTRDNFPTMPANLSVQSVRARLFSSR
jgi:hypothetical protein